jgi:hypothetical protein
MSDKKNNSDQVQGVPDILPVGNAYERMQSFTRQRDAVLRSPDEDTAADDLAPSGKSDSDVDTETTSNHQAVMNEYRRRQRLTRRS